MSFKILLSDVKLHFQHAVTNMYQSLMFHHSSLHLHLGIDSHSLFLFSNLGSNILLIIILFLHILLILLIITMILFLLMLLIIIILLMLLIIIIILVLVLLLIFQHHLHHDFV
jgi:hypothetical protein